MKIAQLQTHVFADKADNMAQLETSIAAVMPENPDLITIGEMFNCPYVTENFPSSRRKKAVTHGRNSALLLPSTVYTFRLAPYQN